MEEEEKEMTESAPSEVSRTRSHVKTASQVSKSPSKKTASQVTSEAQSPIEKTHSQVSRTRSHVSKSPSQEVPENRFGDSRSLGRDFRYVAA